MRVQLSGGPGPQLSRPPGHRRGRPFASPGSPRPRVSLVATPAWFSPEQSHGQPARICKDGRQRRHELSVSYRGIDISKQRLDLARFPQGDAFSMAYTDTGLAKMLKRLQGWFPQIILLEASGGYEYGVVSALVAAGLAPVLINPRQVRDFARSLDILAKTDKIDVKVLAEFAFRVQPEPRPLPAAQQQELNHLLSRRRQLLEMIQMECNRREISPFPRVRQSIDHNLDSLRR